MASSNFVVIAVIAILGMVSGFPQGGPTYSCRNLIPGHINGTQTSPPPYRVSVSNSVIGPGGVTTVVLESTSDFPFKGFLCAVSDMYDETNNTLGMMSFSPSSSSSSPNIIQTVNCSRSTVDTAMTHVSDLEKFRVEFDWIAPLDAYVGQQFKLRCSVVFTFWRCWTNLRADITIGTASTQGSSFTTSSGSSSTSTNTNTGTTTNNAGSSPGVSGPITQSTSIFHPTTAGDSTNMPTSVPVTSNTQPITFTTPNMQGNNNDDNNVINNNNNINMNPTFPTSNPNSLFNSNTNANPNAVADALNRFESRMNALGSNLGSFNANPDLTASQGINSFNGNQNRNPNAVTFTTPDRPTTRNPGQGQGNLNRNPASLRNFNNGNSNPLRNPNSVNSDPFFDTGIVDNGLSDPSLPNMNLVRTNDRFVDLNEVSPISFSFPNAFFMTPGAIRRFQERNLIFQNNLRFTQQDLNMFQEF